MRATSLFPKGRRRIFNSPRGDCSVRGDLPDIAEDNASRRPTCLCLTRSFGGAKTQGIPPALMNNSIEDSRSPLGLVSRQPYADRPVGIKPPRQVVEWN
jgi:hypothetical protein